MLWKDWSLKWELTNALDFSGSEADVADVAIVVADQEAVRGEEPLICPELDRELRELTARGIYTGKPGEVALVPTLGLLPCRYALYVGAEGNRPYAAKALRDAAGALGATLLGYKIKRALVVAPAGPASAENGAGPREAAQALTEGLLLGLYRRNSRSTEGREQASLEEVSFALAADVDRLAWRDGIGAGVRNANAVCYARELTNEPANLLTPERLAQEARSLAETYGLECRIYDETEAAAEGMGGLLAVGGGSVNPPRMIVLKHRGNPDAAETIGLIGKGVTFDTGGISIKPALGMEEMISDMGGAAAVLGAMRAVGEGKPRANVVAVVPAAENMPSGSAFKPGDVVRMYGGKTVEVLNTDAEGRIVLGDGLTTAIREGATKLIDVATLTGAVMHALGDVTSGVFSNDEAYADRFVSDARRAGEYVWPMPTYPEYRRLLKSDVADLKNHGGTWAGAIAGAMFVGSFAEDLPWIHIDIGGTAWMWSDRGFESKGGTGVMVRSLLAHIEESGEGIR
ncbi:leucyl aminopeptidase [Cohnella suwonensis]|uniref:Probable cytosol aminopeptidase n=1 Tax=Cohnella suwonensis TaxID=696072 RepID=A0ABW0LY18_9BACL